MSQALGLLGIPIAHLGKIYGEPGQEHHHAQRLARILQQIERDDFRFDILDHCRGLADYPACCHLVVQRLDQQYPGSLFINIQRQASIQLWLQSVEQQFVGLELLLSSPQASDADRAYLQLMRRFRTMTFGAAQFEPTVFAQAYNDFQTKLSAYFHRRDDLLVFDDVSQLSTQGFDRLCQFLNTSPIPSQPFPCNNQHSELPRQAFLAALQSGKIVSQTGLRPK